MARDWLPFRGRRRAFTEASDQKFKTPQQQQQQQLHFSCIANLAEKKWSRYLKLIFQIFDPKIFNICIYTFKLGTQSVRYVIRMEQVAKIKKQQQHKISINY